MKNGNKVNLITYIESAKAFINLVDICKASESIAQSGKIEPVALVFGSDDFCANIGKLSYKLLIELIKYN